MDDYVGPVCFQDGWHWSVVSGPDGDTPDKKLVLEDTEDGSEFRYRLATDEDIRSWHDRKHERFVTVEAN